MGERSKDLIVINTVVPFLYTYGLHKADERMCERARTLSGRIEGGEQSHHSFVERCRTSGSQCGG